MDKKIISATLGCLFTFILLTTAWDYCRPDPDKLLSKRGAAVSGLQIEKEHHPCASLKDAYDVLPAVAVGRASVAMPIPSLVSGHPPLSFKEDPGEFRGLSPPVSKLFLSELPIYLRLGNLRI